MGAAAQASADYDEDKLSIQRLDEYRAQCITKLPRHKQRRSYTLAAIQKGSALRDNQLELITTGSAMSSSTWLQVKLDYNDTPQVKKSGTASAGMPDWNNLVSGSFRC